MTLLRHLCLQVLFFMAFNNKLKCFINNYPSLSALLTTSLSALLTTTTSLSVQENTHTLSHTHSPVLHSFLSENGFPLNEVSGAEKESQVRHLGTESTPWFGAGPHQAEHTHRHQTAVFRSGETRPEAGSKRALPSNNSGASPLRPGSL